MLKLLEHQIQLLILFFIWACLSSFTGALTGLFVGWFFGKTILGVLAAIGIEGFKMWQIGAFLGFVGSFFRTLSFNSAPKQTSAPNRVNEFGRRP